MRELIDLAVLVHSSSQSPAAGKSRTSHAVMATDFGADANLGIWRFEFVLQRMESGLEKVDLLRMMGSSGSRE
jgi:hypothetical protein